MISIMNLDSKTFHENLRALTADLQKESTVQEKVERLIKIPLRLSDIESRMAAKAA